MFMKRIFFLILLVLASAALGDERSEKRQLVSELLEVIDAKAFVQVSFTNFMKTMILTFRNAESHGAAPESEDIPAEYRAQFEEEQLKEQKRLGEFRERMFAQIDYAKYFDEVYVPMFEEEFTADELRQMIAFFKTKPGQKLAKVLPHLGIGTDEKSASMIYEAGEAAEREIQKEDAAKHPWKKTMQDLRSLATAVESRATDENEYPKVGFDLLEPLITPTYIRDMPKVDSWGTAFFYVSDGQHYRFVSAGADRRFEWSSRHLDLTNTEPKFADDADADIIFQDGNFLQSPKAILRQ